MGLKALHLATLAELYPTRPAAMLSSPIRSILLQPPCIFPWLWTGGQPVWKYQFEIPPAKECQLLVGHCSKCFPPHMACLLNSFSEDSYFAKRMFVAIFWIVIQFLDSLSFAIENKTELRAHTHTQ